MRRKSAEPLPTSTARWDSYSAGTEPHRTGAELGRAALVGVVVCGAPRSRRRGVRRTLEGRSLCAIWECGASPSVSSNPAYGVSRTLTAIDDLQLLATYVPAPELAVCPNYIQERNLQVGSGVLRPLAPRG